MTEHYEPLVVDAPGAVGHRTVKAPYDGEILAEVHSA